MVPRPFRSLDMPRYAAAVHWPATTATEPGRGPVPCSAGQRRSVPVMTGSRRRRSLLPEALLVAGLSLLAALVLRSVAPPSLVRDGERLPVGLAAQHGQLSGHHGSIAGGGAAPSPVSDEPVAYFLGSAFLIAHLLAVMLAAGIPLIR